MLLRSCAPAIERPFMGKSARAVFERSARTDHGRCAERNRAIPHTLQQRGKRIAIEADIRIEHGNKGSRGTPKSCIVVGTESLRDRIVDLPLPVGPVTSRMPCGSCV